MRRRENLCALLLAFLCLSVALCMGCEYGPLLFEPEPTPIIIEPRPEPRPVVVPEEQVIPYALVEQIQEGMTEAEIEAIVGKDMEFTGPDEGSRFSSLTYEYARNRDGELRRLLVTLDGDLKVVRRGVGFEVR